MTPQELRKLVAELRAANTASAPAIGQRTQTVATPTPSTDSLTRAALCGTKGESSDTKDITIVELQRLRNRGQPITMVTAYDFPSAVHVDKAGIDIILVGDSVGMVVLGYDTTLPVTFEEILHHCRAVSRGAQRPLLVGDLPFGSYEVSPDQAQRNAYRLLKEGGMEAVKIEGAEAGRLRTVEVLVRGGVAVMGHIGLTPQSYSTLGGFRAQGRHAKQAAELVEQARRLEGAGAFAIVVECVPPEVARELTAAVSVPTIGIGAGPHTSGQVLVYHDLLGMMQHPHHAKVTPKFCKQYGAVGSVINDAIRAFAREVREGVFPGPAFSPYTMAPGELDAFRAHLAAAVDTAGSAAVVGGGRPGADAAGETIRVY